MKNAINEEFYLLEFFSDGSQEIELPLEVEANDILLFVRGLLQEPGFAYWTYNKDGATVICCNKNCNINKGDFVVAKAHAKKQKQEIKC